MSEEAVAQEAPVSRQDAYLKSQQGKYDSEYAEPVGESDAEDGAPDESMESEAGADGALAVDETEEQESDAEGAPDELEPEGVDWEKRYKDTQADNESAREEARAARTELAEGMRDITDARLTLQESLDNAEQTAQFWANQAQQELQQLNAVNVSQLSQEQYAQWQQLKLQATQKAQYMNNALAQTQDQAKAEKNKAIQREAKIAREYLVRTIPDFDNVYPEIQKHAISTRGINPKVVRDITDPALILMIHEDMQARSQPDAVEEIVTKTKAKKRVSNTLRARDAKGRYKQHDREFKEAKTLAGRKNAYLKREEERYKREYGR